MRADFSLWPGIFTWERRWEKLAGLFFFGPGQECRIEGMGGQTREDEGDKRWCSSLRKIGGGVVSGA